MKIKTAILVDNRVLTRWQKNALNEAKEKIDILLILNCTNTKSKRNIFKNFFYYILNCCSLRNSLTKKEPLSDIEAERINFTSEYKGAWQTIPKAIVAKLKTKEISLVIKFGMGLVRIDESLLNIPVLSYHHGNPSKYRGRPAGFYEILNGEDEVGIIVQRINNELDAGEILAFAESKIFNFSYKKTSLTYYRNSRHLLSKAIDNLLQKVPIKIPVNGKNYKLPNNFTVLKFVVLLAYNLLNKLIYGIFFEKKWNVALTNQFLKLDGDEIILAHQLKKLPVLRNYNFYADPFFSCDGTKIRLEALRNKSGLGDLVEICAKDFNKQSVLASGQHYSYPFSFLFEENEYVLPEVASHSPQFFSPITGNDNTNHYIKGLEDKRLVDATLIEHNHKWFLFFGENQTALDILNLWLSDSPFGEFKPHPKTPIVMSPKTPSIPAVLPTFTLLPP